MDDPVSEASWLALLEEAAKTATDIEGRVELVEKYKKATLAEPYSIHIWLGYCEYMSSLFRKSFGLEEDITWEEEDRLLGQELFTKETVMEIWEEGLKTTKYRIDDSHLLWNAFIAHQRSHDPKTDHIRELFLERLQVPHATWDETSQEFSTFLTSTEAENYEETMIEVTKLAKHGKALYAEREPYELKLKAAISSNNHEAIQAILADYLDWEVKQSRKKNGVPELSYTLYERALLLYGSVVSLWEDYVGAISNALSHDDQVNKNDESAPDLFAVLERATEHCPWSGSLWSRYIIRAEIDGRELEEIEEIKDEAAARGTLDRNGMADVILVYATWCGYLRRWAVESAAQAEAEEYVNGQIASSLEAVQNWGEELYGKKDYKGDPAFTLERHYIQFYKEWTKTDEARELWQKLVKSHGHSYEFWQQYYEWEMIADDEERRPFATAVLKQAVSNRNLDWPEKILEIYGRHCSIYGDAVTIATATDAILRNSKGIAKRRQREAMEAQEAYAAQVQPDNSSAPEGRAKDVSGASKRKRESIDEGINKKVKSENPDISAQNLKRDRENTTILVTNLPNSVTQTKVKLYFKEFGHINNLTVKTDSDGVAAAALIEYRSTEDVLSALLRNDKYFNENQIKVVEGSGLTLYVTNFPPTTDDEFLHKLFKDCGEIFSTRWPSLKYNAHRRFCYVSFKSKAASEKAISTLDGKLLEGKYKLEVKYSDPSSKKPREGAVAEGREVHVGNLDRTANEEELKEVFEKYGKVETVKILRNMAGKSKGGAFVTFVTKESATSALELDKTKFKSQILDVELASATNYKPKATTVTTPTNSSEHQPMDRDAIERRTVTIRNIPDTVNDARIKALAESHGGKVVKLVLKPEISGASVEFEDEGMAGKAALALDGMQFEGSKLSIGNAKPSKMGSTAANGGKSTPALMQQSAAPIRRPGLGGRKKRGGLGS